MKPDLLLICPLFPAAMTQLDAAYTVHRYYQATDKDAFVAGIAVTNTPDVLTECVAEPKVPEALLGLNNVVLQPHVSSGTHWTRAAMGQLVVDNLAAFFAGKPVLTQV